MANLAWSDPNTTLGALWSGSSTLPAGTSPTPKQLSQTVDITEDKFSESVVGKSIPIVIGTGPVPGMIVLGSQVTVTTFYSGTVDAGDAIGGVGDDQGGTGTVGGSSSGSGGGGDGGDLPPDAEFEFVFGALAADISIASLGGSCGTSLVHASNAFQGRVSEILLYQSGVVVDGGTYPALIGSESITIKVHYNGFTNGTRTQSIGSSYYMNLVTGAYQPLFEGEATGTGVIVHMTNAQSLDGSPTCRGFGIFNTGYYSEIGSGDVVTIDGPTLDFGSITMERLDNGTVYSVSGVAVDNLGDPPTDQIWNGRVRLTMTP